MPQKPGEPTKSLKVDSGALREDVYDEYSGSAGNNMSPTWKSVDERASTTSSRK